jgi:3,4-dihydroxy 2-butanone 4-phosphate synthase/GTP cyclohydrolase II
VGAQIVADLGIASMRLMTNNPDKYESIAEFGLSISERVPLITEPTLDNVQYLRTKQAAHPRKRRSGRLFSRHRSRAPMARCGLN